MSLPKTFMDFDRVCGVMDSSNIDVISYSIQFKVMQVRFNNTTIYRYYDVSLSDFGTIVSAESVGAKFNEWKKFNARDYESGGKLYERVD